MLMTSASDMSVNSACDGWADLPDSAATATVTDITLEHING